MTALHDPTALAPRATPSGLILAPVHDVHSPFHPTGLSLTDRLLAQLGALSSLRDRDELDVKLIATLRELMSPLELGIYRLVEEAGTRRWLTRVRVGVADDAVQADLGWADFDTLPDQGAFPHRLQCLQRCAPQQEHGSDGLVAAFPLTLDGELATVLECRIAAPLDASMLATIDGLLKVYCNLHGLLDYSERDTLTGLLNRKSFDSSFYKASIGSLMPAAPAGEERRESSAAIFRLAIIDVDHFKRVNDGFGHLIGDEVLLLLSRVMRRSFRYADRLYRFGGEEFVVLMRCVGEHGAMTALERLRLAVQAYPMPQVGQITISAGFTDVRAGDTPAAAFERADTAVYRAKQAGRNQVLSYESLVREGEIPQESKTGDVEFF